MGEISNTNLEIINAVVDAAEKLAGAAFLLKMFKQKADREAVTAAELAAVRCTTESCARH